jgi:hypothetical protein
VHQLTAEALAKWITVDELLQFDDEVVALAELKLGVDALLQGSEAGLLQPADLLASERLEGEILQRRPAPERERRPELLRALGRGAVPRLGRQPLEARKVEPLGVDAQDVSRGFRDE